MLEAHRELWKGSGDMAGYSKDSLSKITQIHLDVVSCQTCHITQLHDRDDLEQQFTPYYRYHKAEDGKNKIFPYKPRVRFFWRDKNSGRVLTRNEQDAVYEKITKEDGVIVGILKDTSNGKEFEIEPWPYNGVDYYYPYEYGHTFEDDYNARWAYKRAYDKLLKTKGYANPDVQQVWIESNNYIISHNVRQSASSLPCEACHSRKQDGSFSALVAADGLLGNKVVRDIEQALTGIKADPRLVADGVVTSDMPYHRWTEDGRLVTTIAEVLQATKTNPFVSMLKNSSAPVAIGEFKREKLAKVLDITKLNPGPLRNSIVQNFGSLEVLYFDSYQGDASIAQTAFISLAKDPAAAILMPKYRLQSQVFKALSKDVINMIESFSGGKASSVAFHFQALNTDNKVVTALPDQLFIKMPYQGKATSITRIKVIQSVDGSKLEEIAQADILTVSPKTDSTSGYVIFAVDKMGYFAVVDTQ